jgi:DDE family transposase
MPLRKLYSSDNVSQFDGVLDMDRPSLEMLARMPLAEAVLLLWRWMADEESLQSVFQRSRGRCYEKLISFGLLVRLIADALLQYGGSARQSFQRATERCELPASVRAAYGKLSRLPIALSMAFLSSCSDRVRALYPEEARTALPKSLAGFQVVVFDGKAIKRVAKRLKFLRGIAGGLLGGRALVALDLARGLAVTLQAHPDGDANEVRFVPELLPEVRQRVAGVRLWMGDRAFCDLVNAARLVEQGDHFVVRYHPKVPFYPDAARGQREGSDRQGRRYVEQWGWLGSPKNRQRRYVRMITLYRPGEENVILVTDLLDGQEYPADDLLDLYLMRWGIERMFQQVTEVFGLQGLIGGTPQATVFQFAFCLVLYNLIQLVRAYVAAAAQRERETISTENLFEDVRRELIAWNVMMEPEVTVAYFDSEGPWTWSRVKKRLQRLLGSVWTERWIKAAAPHRRPVQSAPPARTHGSVYRILEEHRRERPQEKCVRAAPT